MLTQRCVQPREPQVIVTGERHFLYKYSNAVAGIQGDAFSRIVCDIYFIIYLTTASAAHAISLRRRKLTPCAFILKKLMVVQLITKFTDFIEPTDTWKWRWTAWPWKWRHYDPSKRRKLPAQRLSFTFQTTDIFINTTVRTPNRAHISVLTKGQIWIYPQQFNVIHSAISLR
jgi:hypothetical protein